MRYALAAAVVGLCLWASAFVVTASAHGYPFDRYLAASEPIAAAAWPSLCAEPPAVERAPLVPTTAALADWQYLPSAPTVYFDCKVTVNARVAFTFSSFCTMLVHEYGHLAGLGHSADPTDVMYPVLGATFPACRTVQGRDRHRIRRGRS